MCIWVLLLPNCSCCCFIMLPNCSCCCSIMLSLSQSSSAESNSVEASHLLPQKVVGVCKCPRMTSTKAFLLSHQGRKTDRPHILTVPIYTAHVSATCSVELLRQELWVLMMNLSCKGACRTHQTRFHPIT